METCIEVQNVVKRFRDQVVLKNVSISFEKGADTRHCRAQRLRQNGAF